MTNILPPVSSFDKIKGAVLGTAFGDAWGEEIEFHTHPQIIAKQHTFPKNTAYITDDTQMSLYLMRGIQNLLAHDISISIPADNNSEQEIFNSEALIRVQIAEEFSNWLVDPLNNRAPGFSCIAGASEYSKSNRRTGLEGSQPTAMGCGANMRSMWLGLLPYSELEVARLSLIQAEITHGHPLAGASAVLTSLVVWHSLRNLDFDKLQGEELFDWAIRKCIELSQNSSLQSWRKTNSFTELAELLTKYKNKLPLLEEAIEYGKEIDLEDLFGGGWTAPSAFGNALAVLAVSHHYSALSNMNYLISTSGDSDSIAAIGGAFLGSRYGSQIFPAEWFSQIELNYQDELTEVIDFLQDLTDIKLSP